MQTGELAFSCLLVSLYLSDIILLLVMLVFLFPLINSCYSSGREGEVASLVWGVKIKLNIISSGLLSLSFNHRIWCNLSIKECPT